MMMTRTSGPHPLPHPFHTQAMPAPPPNPAPTHLDIVADVPDLRPQVDQRAVVVVGLGRHGRTAADVLQLTLQRRQLPGGGKGGELGKGFERDTL
jgi:hypothetical protein